MRPILRMLVAVVVSVGVCRGADSVVVVVRDTTGAVMAQSVKKVLSVPKPKTNWSKIKELFM